MSKQQYFQGKPSTVEDPNNKVAEHEKFTPEELKELLDYFGYDFLGCSNGLEKIPDDQISNYKI